MAAVVRDQPRGLLGLGFLRMPGNPELDPAQVRPSPAPLAKQFWCSRGGGGFIKKLICKPNLTFLKVKARRPCSLLCDQSPQARPLRSPAREHTPLALALLCVGETPP